MPHRTAIAVVEREVKRMDWSLKGRRKGMTWSYRI